MTLIPLLASLQASRYGVIATCTLLGPYAERNGTLLSMFQDNPSVQSSKFKQCSLNFEDGPIGCYQTS